MHHQQRLQFIGFNGIKNRFFITCYPLLNTFYQCLFITYVQSYQTINHIFVVVVQRFTASLFIKRDKYSQSRRFICRFVYTLLHESD